MDLKSTLLLTLKGNEEATNKRSQLDFKSRSILTSLRNQEKSLAELLSKIFVENKEALVLVNELLNKGYITTDASKSFAAAERMAAKKAADLLAQKMAAEREAAERRTAELLRAEREEASRLEETRRAEESRRAEEVRRAEQVLAAEREALRQAAEAQAAAQRKLEDEARQQADAERQRAARELERLEAAEKDRARRALEDERKREAAEKLRIEAEAIASARAQEANRQRAKDEAEATARAEAERIRATEANRIAQIQAQEEQLRIDEQWRRDQSAVRGDTHTREPAKKTESTQENFAANEKSRRDAERPIVADQIEILQIDALTESDTIDIVGEDDFASTPKIGSSLRPALSRFIPNILKSQNEYETTQKQQNATHSDHSISDSVHPTKSLPDSVTATGSVRHRVSLQPVASKVHAAQMKQQASLIKPAITAKPSGPGAMESLLGSAGGAGRDFLTTFDKISTDAPTRKTSIRPTKTKIQLKPVSVAANKAMAIKPSVRISEGIFMLSDFCIDHLDVKAAEFIEKIERVRDVKSLQAVVSEIFSALNAKSNDKNAALFKVIESINRSA